MGPDPITSGAAIYDVAICGAGPAGLAAAQILSDTGARIVIIDEQPRAGGQFLRQPPETFKVSGWLSSPLYAAGKTLLKQVAASAKPAWLFGTAIHGLFRERDGSGHPFWRLWLSNDAGMNEVTARAVIVATGCYDLPVPYPGWTLPGVMSAGGIQTLVKSQQVVPGNRIVLSGSHPLQIILAGQLVEAGAEIAALCFSEAWSSVFSVFRSPRVLIEHRRKFLATAKILRDLRRRKIPVHFNTVVTRAIGTDHLEAVEIAPLGAGARPLAEHRKMISCDVAGTCYGFLASSELARQAGAEAVWDPARGGWLVTVDDWQRTSVLGLYAAGEITAVEGSDVAMAEGAMAGLGCAHDLGLFDRAMVQSLTPAVRRQLRRHRRFARTLRRLSLPPADFLQSLRTEDTIVCRCEDLTEGALAAALVANDFIASPNALKLYTRAGMGPCQGRMCGSSVIDLMMTAGRLKPGEPVQGFTPRAPVKPFWLWGLRGFE